MRLLAVALVAALAATSLGQQAETAEFHFPLIKDYGGVAALPGAAEPARSGAKVVFDIAGDSKPDAAHQGLERVARYLNLHALAGHRAGNVKVALVLHGQATKAALRDEAYARQTQVSQNPSLPLLRQLKEAGVETYICGQSLARNGYPLEDAAGELTVAASAMTVVVNKQLDGFAYYPIH